MPRRFLKSIAQAAPVSAYPAVVAVGTGTFTSLGALGVPITTASYLAVAIATTFVIAYEIWLPYRRDWRPGARDLVVDGLFLAAVQVALPAFLSLTLVVVMANALSDAGVPASSLWPHDVPVAVQIVLMILIADFLRYWLHRAFHQIPSLWRLHALHHSPTRLYWLNVGRFHPFEKAAQYLFDALPFALMGVSETVLAGYFVFYAINGFLQHSNCRVALGPLNWIIAGPELHRWHHVCPGACRTSNFGNNLIIWDVVFGTRFLPATGDVEAVGITPLETRVQDDPRAHDIRTPSTRKQ